MKIVQILPGSGGTFYCENCLRDSTLAKALIDRGEDVILVPLYLPMYTDEPQVAERSPVFFGGINAYLQQKLPLFRRTPRWVDRLFDSRALLRLAARRAGSTRAGGLGDMTLSMLRGEEGNQVKELDRLTEWLEQIGRPDVVHISSVMLAGLVRRLKQRLRVPVVCALQDEETWMDALQPPYDLQCWEEMGARARDIDAFFAVSRHYADSMRKRLAVPAEKMHVVHVGINLEGYLPSETEPGRPVIGYLSKLCESLGLGALVDAFMALKRKERLRGLRLRAMGGLTPDNRRYVDGLKRKLAAAGMAGDAEFLEELDRESRLRFLRTLSVMSVPMAQGEAFGTFMLEAWACGVPVVQPLAGAFPEIVGMTGGGVLYEPGAAERLAGALERLLLDPAGARELGQRGARAVRERFGIGTMAENVLRVYRGAMGAGGQ